LKTAPKALSIKTPENSKFNVNSTLQACSCKGVKFQPPSRLLKGPFSSPMVICSFLTSPLQVVWVGAQWGLILTTMGVSLAGGAVRGLASAGTSLLGKQLVESIAKQSVLSGMRLAAEQGGRRAAFGATLWYLSRPVGQLAARGLVTATAATGQGLLVTRTSAIAARQALTTALIGGGISAGCTGAVTLYQSYAAGEDARLTTGQFLAALATSFRSGAAYTLIFVGNIGALGKVFALRSLPLRVGITGAGMGA